MPVSVKEMESKVTAWSLVPENIKERMFNFKVVNVDEMSNEVTFRDMSGRLLYRLVVR